MTRAFHKIPNQYFYQIISPLIHHLKYETLFNSHHLHQNQVPIQRDSVLPREICKKQFMYLIKLKKNQYYGIVFSGEFILIELDEQLWR